MKQIKIRCEFTAWLYVPDSEVVGRHMKDVENAYETYVDEMLDDNFNSSAIHKLDMEVSNAG